MPRHYSTTEVETVLRALGFEMIRQRGSDRRWRGVWGGQRRNVTVVAGQRQIPDGTLRSIATQAGLALDELKKRIEG